MSKISGSDSISKVQNFISKWTEYFEGPEHWKCMFQTPFQRSGTPMIQPSVSKAYNTEVPKLHFKVVQSPEKVWTLFEEAGGILQRLVASDVHRFPEVKFRRSSASERILYEILKVHSFPSAF
ncbi:hypothetical protein RclHR1_01410020 [Rhizophagus clarus]|uniref:Uncharacterized protein n=1 Tax=Rhizophagus clarus TaxID=94130 RepID=A0A2Z6QBQ7_9GLOM|nr:hypothetical protein RclHR1_01410020 [Rhizophagus clarus]